MAKLVVGFSRPSKFKIGSLAIRAWQGFTAYSHVYIKFNNKWLGVDVVYQASHGNVNCLEYSNFLATNIVVKEFEVEVTNEQVRDSVRSCIFLLQKPYGYWGLLKIVLKKLLGVKWEGDRNQSFHCSEFAAIICPNLALDMDPDFIEPVDLYKALEKVK
jgi:hypothetical protein